MPNTRCHCFRDFLPANRPQQVSNLEWLNILSYLLRNFGVFLHINTVNKLIFQINTVKKLISKVAHVTRAQYLIAHMGNRQAPPTCNYFEELQVLGGWDTTWILPSAFSCKIIIIKLLEVLNKRSKPYERTLVDGINESYF